MVRRVTSVKGPPAVRRMTAHWVVLAAATLTTLVAAAAGAALAVFAGQALPQAVRHDLLAAPGTSLAAAGSFASGNPAQTSAALRSMLSPSHLREALRLRAAGGGLVQIGQLLAELDRLAVFESHGNSHL